MLLNSIVRTVKRSIHIMLAFCGFEVARKDDKIILRRCYYIGSNYLSDIGKIIGSAKNVRICIDGGAHHGETALLFSDAFPEATIYSFEPEQNNFLSLTQTISSCKRIIPVNKALGETTAFETFIVNQGSQTGSLLVASQGSEKYVDDPRVMRPVSKERVSTVALQDWVKENAIDSIDLLKLDLQGYELKALEGAKSLLSSKRILFVYLEVNFVPAYEGQATLTALYDYCTNFGYRLVGLYPSEFNAHQFHYRCGGDLLFVLEDLTGYNKKALIAM
jgi:FkbM family methyltransferase